MSVMMCAVCKKGVGPDRCEICGFSDKGIINREFLTDDDERIWYDKVVRPYQMLWETKCQNNELIEMIKGLNLEITDVKNQLKELNQRMQHVAQAAPVSATPVTPVAPPPVTPVAPPPVAPPPVTPVAPPPATPPPVTPVAPVAPPVTPAAPVAPVSTNTAPDEDDDDYPLADLSLLSTSEVVKHDDETNILRKINIDGLDIEKAIDRYEDNEEGYINILNSYVTNIQGKLKDIEVVSTENLKDYNIKIHGIKGINLYIFAEDLATLAESLEHAAMRGELEYVLTNNPIFIEKSLSFIEKLKTQLAKIDI